VSRISVLLRSLALLVVDMTGRVALREVQGVCSHDDDGGHPVTSVPNGRLHRAQLARLEIRPTGRLDKEHLKERIRERVLDRVFLQCGLVHTLLL
jgi:hypothetical protein